MGIMMNSVTKNSFLQYIMNYFLFYNFLSHHVTCLIKNILLAQDSSQVL